MNCGSASSLCGSARTKVARLVDNRDDDVIADRIRDLLEGGR